jgi:hypothetical protein
MHHRFFPELGNGILATHCCILYITGRPIHFLVCAVNKHCVLSTVSVWIAPIPAIKKAAEKLPPHTKICISLFKIILEASGLEPLNLYEELQTTSL